MARRYEEWDEGLTLIKAAADRELSVVDLNLRHRVAVARRHGHSRAVEVPHGLPRLNTLDGNKSDGLGVGAEAVGSI